MIDSACGGTFFSKTEDEAKALFETLAKNSQHHASSGRRAPTNPFNAPKKGGIYEVGHSVGVQDQFLVDLSRKLDKVLLGQFSTPIASVQEACALCASPIHFVSDCPMAAQYPEFVQDQVNALQSFQKPGSDPFSNTYNPGWRNHPNFSWKSQNSNSSPFAQNQRPNVPNQFQQTQYHPPCKDSEILIKIREVIKTLR